MVETTFDDGRVDLILTVSELIPSVFMALSGDTAWTLAVPDVRSDVLQQRSFFLSCRFVSLCNSVSRIGRFPLKNAAADLEVTLN